MGKWWNKTRRGTVFGLWTLCENLGNLIGYFIFEILPGSWYFKTIILGAFIGVCLCYYPCFVDPSPEDTKCSSEFKKELVQFIKLEGKKENEAIPSKNVSNQNEIDSKLPKKNQNQEKQEPKSKEEVSLHTKDESTPSDESKPQQNEKDIELTNKKTEDNQLIHPPASSEAYSHLTWSSIATTLKIKQYSSFKFQC